jgi:hypothetical protein
MKIIRKMLSSYKDNGPRRYFKNAAACRDICDRLSMAIFKKYREVLLKKPITYIVWGVWGTKTDGVLDHIQAEINSLVTPEMNRVMALMDWQSLSEDQAFFMTYMVRGHIISRITYMIEAYKTKSYETTMARESSRTSLNLLQPMGTA